MGGKDRLDKDARRWKRMGAGAHLDDWLDYGPGFQDMRRVAMSLAHTNRPEGKGYNKAFMEVREYHSMGTMDKNAITHVLWLTDEHYPERLEELKKIRDVMTDGERSRLQHPLSARQRVEKALNPKGNGEDKPERKSSKETIQDLHEKLARKDIEIKRLKEKIEFDGAHHSSVKDIESLNDAINAWKSIREALKQQQSITLEEFDEFWELVEYDKTELISLFSQTPEPEASEPETEEDAVEDAPTPRGNCIMTKREAAELGLRTYSTGKACKRGHFSKRDTKFGYCLQCYAEEHPRTKK